MKPLSWRSEGEQKGVENPELPDESKPTEPKSEHKWKRGETKTIK